MPMKSRRYKKTNKSRRTRKNKTTRRYKKQMRGGEYKPRKGLIENEQELKESWGVKSVKFWEVNDGKGTATNIFRNDIDNVEMSYDDFKKMIDYYLKSVTSGNKYAYIREIY